jgi:hypothetical protein
LFVRSTSRVGYVTYLGFDQLEVSREIEILTTEEPTTEKPTTEEPSTEKPTTEEPTTIEPTTLESRTEDKTSSESSSTVDKTTALKTTTLEIQTENSHSQEFGKSTATNSLFPLEFSTTIDEQEQLMTSTADDVSGEDESTYYEIEFENTSSNWLQQNTSAPIISYMTSAEYTTDTDGTREDQPKDITRLLIIIIIVLSAILLVTFSVLLVFFCLSFKSKKVHPKRRNDELEMLSNL